MLPDLPLNHPTRVMETARSFTEMWNAVRLAVSDYPPDQQEAYQLAFYSGARQIISLHRALATHPDRINLRQRIGCEVLTYCKITETDISMPPTVGAFRDAWLAFARGRQYQTPEDPELRDLYRATYYNGANIVMGLELNGVTKSSIAEELDTYLATWKIS